MIRQCFWVLCTGLLAAFLSLTTKCPRLTHIFYTSPQVSLSEDLCFFWRKKSNIKCLPRLFSSYSSVCVHVYVCCIYMSVYVMMIGHTGHWVSPSISLCLVALEQGLSLNWTLSSLARLGGQ